MVQALDVDANISACFVASVSSCDDPRNCRNVWKVILSCFVTIFVWIWIAICPNLPYPVEKQGVGMSFWKKQLHTMRIFFMERFFLCIIGILYPEYALICAVQQRRTARSIAKETGKSFTIIFICFSNLKI